MFPALCVSDGFADIPYHLESISMTHTEGLEREEWKPVGLQYNQGMGDFQEHKTAWVERLPHRGGGVVAALPEQKRSAATSRASWMLMPLMLLS